MQNTADFGYILAVFTRVREAILDRESGSKQLLSSSTSFRRFFSTFSRLTKAHQKS